MGSTKLCGSTCSSSGGSEVLCNILVWTGRTVPRHVRAYGRVFSPKKMFHQQAGPSCLCGCLQGLGISEDLGASCDGSCAQSTAWGGGARPETWSGTRGVMSPRGLGIKAGEEGDSASQPGCRCHWHACHSQRLNWRGLWGRTDRAGLADGWAALAVHPAALLTQHPGESLVQGTC